MTSALRIYGGNAFSYHTMIRQQVPGSSVNIGNITRYSTTTSRHQKLARVHSCDILLDNVPQNCSDLFQLAHERGLIRVALFHSENGDKMSFSYTPREETK